MTQTLQVSSITPEPDLIEQAAKIIRDGGLVAFPTETVYGLGANALDPKAIDRIFAAKGRPVTDPLIAHIASVEQLPDLALEIPQLIISLSKRFWPGPLTLVLKRKPNVPANLSAGRDTVAIRQPAHPIATALIKAASVPIAAPSANLFSRPSPTTAQHVLNDLDDRVDLILDGGPTPLGVESTVLDLTTDPPALLRPGGTSAEALRELIPHLVVTHQMLNASESASSPGQLLKHYSPTAPVTLFIGPRQAVLERMRLAAHHYIAENKKVALLLTTAEAETFADLGISIFDLGTNLESVAQRLFSGLRELDSQTPDIILAHDFGRQGLGLAIWDRLFRAAQGKIVEVESRL
jgi:L-threonylcarbamoyladenylate synthase